MPSRREAILDAAAAVMAERGYERATIRQVARQAGVSDGTIYNYFADKESLLTGLIERLTAYEAARVDLGRSADDFRAVLRAFARHRLDTTGGALELLRATWPELLVRSDLRGAYLDGVVAPAVAAGEALLAASRRRGDLGGPEPAIVSRLVVASLLGVTLLRLLGDRVAQERSEVFPDALVACLVDGLVDAEPPGGAAAGGAVGSGAADSRQTGPET